MKPVLLLWPHCSARLFNGLVLGGGCTASMTKPGVRFYFFSAFCAKHLLLLLILFCYEVAEYALQNINLLFLVSL